MKKDGIELVIFDLGRVLVDFDFKKVIRGLKRHSPLSEAAIEHYFQSTPLWDAFERGLIAPELFFRDLCDHLQLEGLSFKKFAPLWNKIFSEKTDTVEILRQLRRSYKIALLSNINVMHWEHVLNEHAFMKWFDHPVASYAVGHRKPDPEIFHCVLDLAKAAPAQAIFIDDIDAHVQAALNIGIRAYQFTTADRLQSDIADLLR
jgi:glucose-1-phosphatase